MENKKTTRSLNPLLLENEVLRLKLARAEDRLSVLLKGNVNGTNVPDLSNANNKSEEGKRQKGIKLSSLYASMSEGFALHELVYDTSGRPIDYIIRDVNPAFEKITGLNKKSSLGKKATELYSVKEAPYLDTYAEVVSTGRPASFVTYFPPMEKHFNISVFSPGKGKFVTVFQDISERKLTEEKLRIALNRFYLMLSSMRNGLLLLTPDNRVEFANRHFCEVFDLTQSPEELLNLKAGEIISLIKESYIDPEKEIERIKKIVEENLPVTGEEITMKSGRTYLRDFIPLFVGDKNHGRLWVHIDISDVIAESLMRKRSEDALRNSEEKFSRAFKNSPNAITITRLSDGKIIEGNESVYTLLGYNHGDVIGKTTLELGIWSDPAERQKLTQALSSRGFIQNEDFVLRKKDGSLVPVNLSASLITIDYQECFLCSFIDLTERKKSEEALKQSEKLYRAIGESIDYGIWICDADGKNTYASESYLKLVGLTQQQCSDMGWGNSLHPEDADRTMAAWKECSRTGDVWDIEHRFRGVDGKWHPILARGIPVRDDDGNIIYWAGINLDISKIKQTEDALRNSEERILSILNNSLDVIYRMNLQRGVYEFISPSVENIMGFSPEELISLDPVSSISLVHPDDIGILLSAQAQSEDSGTGIAEYRQRIKNGEYRWLSNHMSLTSDTEGRPLYRDGNIRDITEQKRAEQILKESEERFKIIAETEPVLICVTRSADNVVLFTNEVNNKAFGLRGEKIIGTKGPDYYCDPADRERMINLLKEEGIVNNFQVKVKKTDGTPFWIMTSVRPIIYNGQPAMIGASIDISESKKIEEALLLSEERFRNLIKYAPAVIYEMDIHGEKFLSVNDTMCTLLGYTREELALIRPADLLDKASQINFRARSMRRLKGEKLVENIEYRVRTKSGEWVDTLITVGNLSFSIESEPNITVIAYDITERKKMEAVLRESEKKFRELVKYAPTAIYEFDFISKKFTTVNDAMCNMSGYSRKELLSLNALDILEDESKTLFLSRVSMCLKGEKPEDVVEYRVRSKSGRILNVVLNMKFNIDKNGRPNSAMVVGHDITERKLAEEELLSNEAKLKELIATKDKFFNIVAHDLKNPFTSLLGSSELLFNNIDQMTRQNVKKLALILNDSAKGGYAILQNLLDWSRSQTGILKFNPEKVNLKSVIDENIHNLHLQGINKGIFLRSELTEDFFINADKNMINTILRNLLSNAVKYTYKNGKVSISVSEDMEEITISVHDSGIGISKEKAETLFRIENSLSLPGTEKEQGTGLGLKLCKEFTERMGGRIWVESEPGKGSDFKFTIPGKL